MEQLLIQSIDELRLTVNVNASLPFDKVRPHLQGAFVKHFLPTLGTSLAESVQGAMMDDGVLYEVRTAAMMALGAIGVALASAELGIQLGDSGHTVMQTDRFRVASDAKIALAVGEMKGRYRTYMDAMLMLLETHKAEFPAWGESEYRLRQEKNPVLFDGVSDFEHHGMELRGSILAYEGYRLEIGRWMWLLRGVVKDASLYKRVLATMVASDVEISELLCLCKRWIVACIMKDELLMGVLGDEIGSAVAQLSSVGGESTDVVGDFSTEHNFCV